jgi:hypothetical protein
MIFWRLINYNVVGTQILFAAESWNQGSPIPSLGFTLIAWGYYVVVMSAPKKK